jgi:hypothetical protein
MSSRFSINELLKIETWARHGLSETEIRILLQCSPEGWKARLKLDGLAFYNSLEFGNTVGIAEVAAALHKSARSGTDTGAARFAMERRARGTWLPPSATGPTLTVFAVPWAQLDLDDIDRRLARQSALLDGRTIDVTPEDPAGLAPSAGAGKDG